MRANRARWARLFLSSGTLAVVLAGAEIATRLLVRGTTADSRSHLNGRWMARNVEWNRDRFRSRDVSMPKPPGTYRVAVVGDSFTFGQGVAAHDRFSDVLDAALRSRGVEVLNFGRPGSDTADQLSFLHTHVLKTQPDFVVLQWYMNDVEGRDRAGAVPDRTPRWFRSLDEWLVQRSAVYSIATLAAQRALGSNQGYIKRIQARFGDPTSEASRRSTRLLREFIEVCRRERIGIGIVIFSDLTHDPSEPYPYAFLEDRILEVCREMNVRCIDLRSRLSRFPSWKALWVTRWDPHPGALVNRIAADAILEAWGPAWVDARDAAR